MIWIFLGFTLSIYYAIEIAREHIEAYQNANTDRSTLTNVLLVTAHPDDECMFFVPILRVLIRMGVTVHVLCLSIGDYNGLGSIRIHELEASCAILGVECTIIDDDALKDGPAKWDPADISRVLEAFLTKNPDFKTILTFDRFGISSHPNHCDVSTGVRYFACRTQLAEYTLMELDTVPLWRKYLGPLSLIYEFVRLHLINLTNSQFIAVVSWVDYYKYGIKAMLRHRSQLLWFRFLYLLFSCYLHLNTIIIKKPIPKKN